MPGFLIKRIFLISIRGRAALSVLSVFFRYDYSKRYGNVVRFVRFWRSKIEKTKERGGEIMTPKLSPDARAARAKYMREWRKKNPGKQREYDAARWERKAQRIRAEREAAADEAQSETT